jgi:hypothetical protein
MPPVPVRGTELCPVVVPLALPVVSFLFFLFWKSYNIHINIYIYIYIGKLVPFHPCVPGSPTTATQGPRTQVRHVVPPW